MEPCCLKWSGIRGQQKSVTRKVQPEIFRYRVVFFLKVMGLPVRWVNYRLNDLKLGADLSYSFSWVLFY